MKKPHYGWVICASCTLLTICAMGMNTNVFSMFQSYIVRLNGFTNTQGSLLSTVKLLVALVCMLFALKFYNVFKLRLGMTLACLFSGTAHVIYALSHTFIGYAIGATFAGMAYGLGSMIPVSIIVNSWFIKRKGLALGICAAGSGMCTIIFPPIVTPIIEQNGMTAGFLSVAGFILFSAVVLFFTLRDTPAQIKLLPYGAEEAPQDGQQPAAAPAPMHHKPFSNTGVILSLLMMMLLGACSIPNTAHYSIHFITEGHDSVTVSLGLSLFGLMLSSSKCIYGILNDRFGTYRCNFLFLCVLITGNILASIAKASTPLMMLSLALMALGFPPSSVGASLWAGDLFDADQYKKIVQRFQIAYVFGGFAGSALPGILADLTGHYNIVYLLYAFGVAVVLIVLQSFYARYRPDLLLHPKKLKEQARA